MDMRSVLHLTLAFAACSATLLAQADMQGARIREHVKFLASDLLEGRGVGTRGGDLAVQYLASQFALAGLKPAGDKGTWFQKVDLVGVEPQPSSSLRISANGQSQNFVWQTDFVGNTQQQKPESRVSAEVVFVGHGITAPEFGRDDYAGVDVTGKVVLLFTNEPPSEDAAYFGGKALTYYGRWTYKYEEAARRGAAACIIIHTSPTAGYGWEVVKSSWSKEDPQVRRRPEEKAMALAAWISKPAAEKLLALIQKRPDEMLAEADSKGFRAYSLPLRVEAEVRAKLREIRAANVVGKVEGADPARAGEAVVFSAHWDHLGIGIPKDGDAIYNGAVDNATGCGILIEAARAWANLKLRPKRTAIFTAVTAEESGLRGAEFYSANPLIPMGKTALNINWDSFYPFGRLKDVVVTGAERTTVYPIVQAVAQRMQLRIKPDPHPEQGHYYRSDHFAFARAGVPAFSVNMGTDFWGKDETYGDQVFYEYNSKNYHQPSDEYQESWDFSGIEQMGRFGFAIGLQVANMATLPTWRPGDEFLPAREASWKK